MTVSKCKITLVQLSKQVNSSPIEVWRILSGETTRNIDLAKALETKIGLSAQILMFRETSNVRQGVLDWLATYLSTAKNTVWRFIHGHCPPSQKLRKKLCKFSGIAPDAWESENANANWLLSKRGVENAGNREQEK